MSADARPDRPWWRDFFDADYRRLWAPVSGAERTEHELQGLLPMLARWQHALGRPLELADVCGGDGRIARPLAARTEHRVTVVDASADMLAHGRSQVAGDASCGALAWLCADARALPLAPASFDVALCMFTSLGLCDDDAEHVRMLGEMGRALRPGGRLVLELTHRDFAAALAVRRSWFSLGDEDEGCVVLRSFDFEPLSGRSRESLRVVGAAPGALDRVRRWSVRLYTPTELSRMLRAVGLEPEGFYAGLDEQPFVTDEPRLVIVARRGGALPEREILPMGERPTSWRTILERLRCPTTQQPLSLMDPERLAALNEAVAEVSGTLDAALVREDGAVAYPVRGDVPMLLPDEAIALDAPAG